MFAIISSLKSLVFIAIGIFGIGALIGIHEFGHLLFAKLFGVRAPSFSIGMGPTLWRKTIAGTEFKVSAIPMAGYVEIAGLAEIGQGDQQNATATDANSFARKIWWQKMFILSGGILFQIVFTYLVFVGLFMVGMPKSMFYQAETMRPIIGTIRDGSCAQRVNLAIGDEIIATNQQPITNVTQVIKALQANKEKNLVFTIKRNEQTLTINVTPDNKGSVGITSFAPQRVASQGLVQATVNAWHLTNTMITKTIGAFAQLFKQRTLDGIGGPLLIITALVNNAKQSAAVFLFFLAFISINLAILNLIPLPITDGGQIVLTTIETVIRRKIPESIMLAIHYASWALILLLMVYLTIKDFIWLFLPKIKAWF